jgi:hypothetical protein
MLAGEAMAVGLELRERGEEGVKYAVQTSIMIRAGRAPQPMRLEKPEAR